MKATFAAFAAYRRLPVAAAVVLPLVLLVAHACAQLNLPVRELEGIDIEEKLGEFAPMDLTFTDERGNTVSLKNTVSGERPVILTLNYYGCPMLCGLQLDGLIEGLLALDEQGWSAGEKYDLLTVSFDHRETPRLAMLAKQEYAGRLGGGKAAENWSFLVGREDNIRKLTNAVGFGFAWNPQRGEYMHGAAIILLSPEGKVTRYLYGVIYEPQQLRLALLEASEGTVGTTLDRFILSCYVYDPNAQGYTLAAVGLMKMGGAVTIVLVGLGLTILWKRDAARKQTSVEGASS